MFDWKKTILTGGSSDFIDPINPKFGSDVIIRLKIYKENPVESVFIRTAPNGEQINLKMTKIKTDDFYSIYEASIKIVTKITTYRFGIITNDDFFWFNSEDLLLKITPSDNHDFKLIADFEDPTWVKETIFYQIFPDRFFDGNPSENVKSGEYNLHGNNTHQRSWNDINSKEGNNPWLDFYGGDLEGIKQKISYFKELGITGLYLNPIFSAPSNHKYDIINYKMIDKHFGTNEEFASLVSELHNNGIKIILDGIFNHTGEGHYWFNKLKLFNNSDGAFNNKDSPYYDYYSFNNWPEDYESWMGHKSLPKLNYNSSNLRKEIYQDDNSVMKFWLSEPYNIDGWRIDVANMLARQNESQLYHEIWKDIRKEVKGVKPEAYIMGEHFFDGTSLLTGNMLDAVMNYQGFTFALLKWLTKKELTYLSTVRGVEKKFGPIQFTAIDLLNQINQFRNLIPFQLQLLSFNLLGSHDVPRFFTRINKHVFQYKIAIIFLFTYIGVPSIYYGDEIGMEGSFDPDNRRPMIWNKEQWNLPILELYKHMVHLRNSRSELKFGIFKELFVEDEIFVFARLYDSSISIIILNNNDGIKTIVLPVWRIGLINKVVQSYIDGESYSIKEGLFEVELQNYQSMILLT